MSEHSSDIQVVDLGRDYGSPDHPRQHARGRSPPRTRIPRSVSEFTTFRGSQSNPIGNLPYFDEESPNLSLHYDYNSSIEDWRFEERRDMSQFVDNSVKEDLNALDPFRDDAFNVPREVRQSISGDAASASASTLIHDTCSPLAEYLQMDITTDRL